MAQRYNPPPNWPPPPVGWVPPAGWQPDPQWGPPPQGWSLWVEDRSARPWLVRHKIVSGVLSILALFLVVGALASLGADEVEAVPTSQSSASTSAESSIGEDAAEEAAATDEAAAAQAAAEAEEAAAAEVVAEAIAEAEEAEKARAKAKAVILKNPASYASISPRKFSLVAKNPDDYKGKRYLIYGVVSQFDAATGKGSFLANTGSRAYVEDWYNYDQNSMVNGDEGLLKNVVEDDIVKLYVTVDGSFSYDTQIGGNTTVPAFTVHKIKVIGASS